MSDSFLIVQPRLCHETRGLWDSCWHSLFRGSLLACSFPWSCQQLPAKEKKPPRGVNLSFELMMYLAGVQYPLEFAGTIAFKGHFNILVPVQRVNDMIQWHLETNEFNGTSLIGLESVLVEYTSLCTTLLQKLDGLCLSWALSGILQSNQSAKHDDALSVYATAAINDEQAAFTALKSCWTQTAYTDLSGKEISVGDRVKLVLSMIQHRLDANVARSMKTSSFSRFPWLSQGLPAWDPSDIVFLELLSQRPKIEFKTDSGLRPNLFQVSPEALTICGKNSGRPIRPAPSMSAHLCSKCHQDPQKRQCLVVTVKDIWSGFFMQRGLTWGEQKRQNAFKPCCSPPSCGHQHRIQTIVRRDEQIPPMDSTCTLTEAGAMIIANPKAFSADNCQSNTESITNVPARYPRQCFCDRPKGPMSIIPLPFWRTTSVWKHVKISMPDPFRLNHYRCSQAVSVGLYSESLWSVLKHVLRLRVLTHPGG